MNRRRQALVGLLALVAAISIILLAAQHHCPPEGIAFTEYRRNIHRLKNRTELPKETDFDSRITLAALLQPGDDSSRWSNTKAARVEGYVVSLANAGVELANCYGPCRRDIHINVALDPQAPVTKQVVLEITPAFQKRAMANGWDWSEQNLRSKLVGRWCSFEGWLFYDLHHVPESENVAPGRHGNWRATAWELHPVTNFRIIR